MSERFINPFVDYGFKKLFATDSNKDLLISLLNAILDNTDDPIVDLFYKNVEQIGEFNGTRTNYFDVYCETKNKQQFIVEMQNSWQPFFKDRTVYYASKPIRDQGLKEIASSDNKKKPKWNYRLNEVYLIAIMNFTFPKKEYNSQSYFHKVMLSDIDDHHVFYDKLTLYYVEMPKLDGITLELITPLDKWLYALYHLWRYDDYPDELEEEIFHKLYEQAEYARFTPEQQLAYERSRKVYYDTFNEIEGGRIMGREEGYQWGFEEGREEGFEKGKEEGFEKGREEGLVKGREEGLVEGREEGLVEGATKSKVEIAQRMMDLGFDKSIILKAVEMSEEEFKDI